VRSVEPKSKAEKSGFKAGDVILGIGKKPVEKISDVRKALRKFDEGEKVECEISRKGKRMTLSVEVPELSSNDGYYFHFDPQSNNFEHFNFDFDDDDWNDMNQLRLERHQLNRDTDNLRKNLDELKRTIRDNVVKLREELRSTLKEVIGS
jgi:C-terminal processing protease CtpA/Prc